MARDSYPRQITEYMLAELTGKDRATVKRRLEDIEPVKQDKRSKYYDLKVALKAIFEPLKNEFADEDQGFLNPMMEKARLDRARRIAVELDNEIKKKQLIPRDELKQTLANIFGAVRSKLLNVPLKASQSMPDNPTRKQLKAHLQKLVSEALKELSEKNFNESL